MNWEQGASAPNMALLFHTFNKLLYFISEVKFFCLNPKFSITTELIEISFQGKLKIGTGMVLGYFLPPIKYRLSKYRAKLVVAKLFETIRKIYDQSSRVFKKEKKEVENRKMKRL